MSPTTTISPEIDPGEKRLAYVRLRTSPTIADLLFREMRERGFRTTSTAVHIILLQHFQRKLQKGPRDPHHPILDDLEEAHNAAIEKLADGRLDLEDIPEIQKPLARAQNAMWNEELGRQP